MNTKRKILTLKKAAALRQIAGRSGKKTVFTNGCFDILHSGHVFLLEKARSLGDILIAGLNSDASVRRLKGARRPFNKLSDRARVLAALESVDMVVAFTQDTPYELIKALKPDVLVKGADYGGRSIVGREFAGRTVRVPLVKGLSTTGLAGKIKCCGTTFYPTRHGVFHPRAGDEGEISFPLKLPLAARLPRPKGRGMVKIFAAKIFNQKSKIKTKKGVKFNKI